ncbi:MAG: hypothetical protein WC683_20555 [bacterium]
MTNLQQSIEQQVSAFVRNISDLVRRAAIDALERASVVPAVDVVGVEEQRKPRRTSTGKGRQRLARKPAPAREPAELAALTERLYEAIASHPGETMEVLAAVVGCPGKQLRVSIEHLLTRERVRKAGERRSTRYFPMDTDGR